MLALDAPLAGAGASVGKHALEHGVHIVGGGGLDGGLRDGVVLQQGHLLAVDQLGHPCEGAGPLVHPAVGEGGKGLGHIPDVDPVGQAAHGHGGHVDVGLPFPVDHPARLQFNVVALLYKLEALLRIDIVGHDAHRRRIQRPLQRLKHGDQAPVVGCARVLGPGAAGAGVVGVVVQYGIGVDPAELQSGRVDRQGLEGGTGLAVAGVGVVAAPIYCLVPELAHNGGHISRLVVDDADGRLHLLAVLGGVI